MAGAHDHDRSTENAIVTALYSTLYHLEERSSYVRMLFVDFSLAFNTILTDRLVFKQPWVYHSTDRLVFKQPWVYHSTPALGSRTSCLTAPRG